MLSQEAFPITGPYRELLLILEVIITFLFIERAFILWVKVRTRKKNELKFLQEKAYAWLFLGYSSMWAFIVISDFHVQSALLRDIVINIGFFLQILCIILFFRTMEGYKVYIKKYIFTKASVIIFIIYLIIIILNFYIASYFSSIFWILFIIFFAVYFKDLKTNLHAKKEISNLNFEIFKFIMGLVFVFIGYQLTTRFIVATLGIVYRLFGDIFQLLGFVLLTWFFISVPSFTEYVWQDKLESIFIIHKSGLLIYHKKFREEVDTSLNDSIASGRLAMLKMMLEKTTRVEGTSIIEKEGKIVIIQSTDFFYAILICDEMLASYPILLNKLIDRIQQIYSGIFEDWRGNLNVFSSIGNIVKEVFF